MDFSESTHGHPLLLKWLFREKNSQHKYFFRKLRKTIDNILFEFGQDSGTNVSASSFASVVTLSLTCNLTAREHVDSGFGR